MNNSTSSSSLSSRHNNNNQNNNNNKPHQLKLTDYLRPVFQEAVLIKEYCQFTLIQKNAFDSSTTGTTDQQQSNSSKALTGLYVIPSAQNVYIWFGLLTINNERALLSGSNNTTPSSSPWNGACIRFQIYFPDTTKSPPQQQQHSHHQLPQIYLAPIGPSSNSTSSTSSSSSSATTMFKHLSTHPDVNPATGQFNLRQWYSNTASSNAGNPRIYKVLKAFRKSFYKLDPSSSNPEYCSEEYLKKCSLEAAESVKWVGEVDKWLVKRFGGDRNLVLLGGNNNGGGGGCVERQVGKKNSDNVGLNSNNKRSTTTKHLGLSFL